MVIGYFGFIFITNPIQVPPYPFFYQEDISIELDRKPHLLIIGDRMGKTLVNYQKTLIAEISRNLENPITISNISQNGEGIHRTFEKIKKIDNLPNIVIYYGGSEEFYEYKMYPQSLPDIISNLTRFQNDTLKTVLEIVPELSKIFFYPVKRYPLTRKIREMNQNLSAKEVMEIEQTTHILYEIILEEMIRFLKKKGKNLIIITPPINLLTFPKKVCENTTSDKIILHQEYCFNLLQKNDFKQAIIELEALLKIMPANALTNFLLGKAYLGMGKVQEGQKYLEMATAYDCGLWRNSIVINSIQIKLALKYDVNIIDYHSLINNHIGKNILFLDDIFPQHVYDEKLIQILSRPVKKYLKL